MSTRGVKINKGTLGPNVLGGPDSISGMLLQGVAVAGLVAFGQVLELRSTKAAEDLGLTAAYDETNSVRVHYHIEEFFRMAGEGTKLYFMLAPQTKTLTQLCDITDADDYARKLILGGKNEIKQLGIGRNPAAGYTATILNGIDGDVLAAIPKAQALHQWAYDNFRPCQVLLEGRDFTGVAGSVQNLRGIVNVKATKVSVVVGQDFKFAATLDALGKKHAAIGALLGCVAKARINQNVGEVDEAAGFVLTDAGRGRWLVGGLSGHLTAESVEADWDVIDEKGYVFGQTYVGADGVRWNNDHTCCPVERDAQGRINEHTIALGRTADKAVRKLRTALLPKVKSVQPIDPTSGKLPIGVVKYFEGLGDDVFGEMEGAAEISRGKTFVDASSNLLTVPRVLKAGFSITPYGTIDKIEGTINLKATI